MNIDDCGLDLLDKSLDVITPYTPLGETGSISLGKLLHDGGETPPDMMTMLQNVHDMTKQVLSLIEAQDSCNEDYPKKRPRR